MFRIPEIDYDEHPFYHQFAKKHSESVRAAILKEFETQRSRIEQLFPEFTLRRSDAIGTDDPELWQTFARDGVAQNRLEETFLADAIVHLNSVAERMVRSGYKSHQRSLTERKPGLKIDPGMLEIARRINRELRLVELAQSVLQTDHLDVKMTLRHSLVRDAQSGITYFDPYDVRIPRTDLMHFDFPGASMKYMIYLTDVRSEADGPFAYIKTSQIQTTTWRDLVDRLAADSTMSKFPSQNKFETFMGLPSELRKRSQFGLDVVPGSLEEENLLEQETTFFGPAGTGILFDTLGVHRGGLVIEGYRRVFQLTFTGLYPKKSRAARLVDPMSAPGTSAT